MATPDVRIRLSAEGVAEVVAAMQRVSSAAQTHGKRASEGFAPMNSVLAGARVALGSLLAVVSVGALVNFARGAAAVADDLGKMQERLGASAESVSALSAVAKVADVELNQLQSSFGPFAKQTVLLTEGSSKASDAFAKLGIAAKDLRGKDLAEQMAAVARALSTLQNGPEKAAIAMDLFGKKGLQLIPFLNALGRTSEAEFKALGDLFSSVTVNGVSQLNDSLKLLKLEVQGVAAAFVSGMAGPVTRAISDVSKELMGTGVNAWRRYGLEAGRVVGAMMIYLQHYFDFFATESQAMALRLQRLSEVIRAFISGQAWSTGPIWARYAAELEAIAKEFDKRTADRQRKVAEVMKTGLVPGAAPASPGRAAKETEAKAVAETAALRRQADAEMKLAESWAKQQEAMQKSAYDRGLITLEQYYARRRELMLEEFHAEKAALAARRAEEEKKPETPEREATLATIDAQLETKQAETQTKAIQLTDEERNARQSLADQVMRGYREIMAVRGEEHELAMSNIDEEVEKFATAINALMGAGSAESEAAIQRFRETKELEESILDASRQARRAMDDFDLRRSEIQSRAAVGLQSQVDADRDILDLEKAQLPVLRERAAELTATAQRSGLPEQIRAAREFALSVEQIGLAVETTENVTAHMAATFQDSATSALADFFSTGITQAQSFGDAVRTMALSVIDSLRRMLAQFLAVQMMQSILGMFGGGLPTKSMSAAASAPFPLPTKRARGGYIHGPGTVTSDSIPALLSRGEYVVRAAVVARPGILRHLEQLNLGFVTPKLIRHGEPLRFAAGGLVNPAGASTASQRVDGTVTLALEDGLILRSLESPEGQRVALRVLQKNRRAASQALGG